MKRTGVCAGFFVAFVLFAGCGEEESPGTDGGLGGRLEINAVFDDRVIPLAAVEETRVPA